MTKTAGRLFLLKIGGTAVAGLRNVSLSVNGTPINVTDQGDSGVQSLLSGELTGQSLEITGDGIEEDQVLRDLSLGAASGKFLTNMTLDFPAQTGVSSDEISGNFAMTAYSETGAYEDAVTFTTTFTSNGAWTFTKGA